MRFNPVSSMVGHRPRPGRLNSLNPINPVIPPGASYQTYFKPSKIRRLLAHNCRRSIRGGRFR